MIFGFLRAFALFILIYPISLLSSIISWLFTPLIALFVVLEYYTTTVKRFEHTELTLKREFLASYLRWFQSVDNACDEYWYGVYNIDSVIPYLRTATHEQYLSSPFLRYLCRCLWLWRNAAGGFAYYPFGVIRDEPYSVTIAGVKNSGSLWYRLTLRKSSWQLSAQIPVGFGLYNDINIGWKPFNDMPRLAYAGRLFGLRRASAK